MSHATYLRPLLHTFLEGASHFALGGQGRGFLDELVVDLLVDESAGASAAALAHVGENGVVANGDGLVHF